MADPTPPIQTHWKKLRNPDYLGAYSFNYPTEERIYTIREARKEMVPGTDGKKQECLVVHWREQEKPMIINATNAKTISRLAKSPYVENWVGTRVQIYIAQVRAFGEVTEALRIRPTAPAAHNQQPQTTPSPQTAPAPTQEEISDIVFQIELIEDLKALQDYYTGLESQYRNHPDVVKAKDEKKKSMST